MKLRIKRVNTQHYEINIFGNDGTPLVSHTGTTSQKRHTQYALMLGISLSDFEALFAAIAVQEWTTTNKPFGEWELPGPVPVLAPPPEIPHVRIRPIIKVSDSTTVVTGETMEDALRKALDRADIKYLDPRIEWDDKAALCCLDVDYDTPKTPQYLNSLIGSISPHPFCWHPSHGGGVKLYYHAASGFPADEFASLAGARIGLADYEAKFELKRDSRHPFYARTGSKASWAVKPNLLVAGTQTTSMPALGMFFASDVKHNDEFQELRDAWLAERGWSIGDRPTGHEQCPIHPSTISSLNALQIGEEVLTCHYCKDKGYALPGENPGIMHYANLGAGHSAASLLRMMVKNFTHWGHAQHVFRQIIPNYRRIPEEMMQKAYSAALRSIHGVDDLRIPLVFVRGRGIVRLNGRWASADGSADFSKGIETTLKLLPAVMREDVDKKGNPTLKFDTERVDEFKQTSWDLTDYGYPALMPVTGFRIWGQHNSYRDAKIRYTVTPSWLPENRKPRYIPQKERTPAAMKEAYEEINHVCPGIDMNFLKLLMLMKGYAEAGAVQAAFVIVTGPSGSGKSTICDLAAAMCGDEGSALLYTPDRTRFMQGVRACADVAGIIRCDEIFKEADASKVSYRTAMDAFLTVTEETRSHVMYQGMAPLGKNPLIVLTDIDIPESVRRDVQLGRRFVEVRLHSQVDWAPIWGKLGLSRARDFRLLSSRAAWAADMLLSEVCDMLLPGANDQPPQLRDLLPTLGYSYMMDGITLDTDEKIKEFYQLVLAEPEMTEANIKKYGKWKRIKKGDGTPLTLAWESVKDSGKDDTSRTLKERDLSKILSVEPGLRFDVKSSEGYVYVKFYRGGAHKPTWLNGKEQ